MCEQGVPVLHARLSKRDCRRGPGEGRGRWGRAGGGPDQEIHHELVLPGEPGTQVVQALAPRVVLELRVEETEAGVEAPDGPPIAGDVLPVLVQGTATASELAVRANVGLQCVLDRCRQGGALLPPRLDVLGQGGALPVGHGIAQAGNAVREEQVIVNDRLPDLHTIIAGSLCLAGHPLKPLSCLKEAGGGGEVRSCRTVLLGRLPLRGSCCH